MSLPPMTSVPDRPAGDDQQLAPDEMARHEDAEQPQQAAGRDHDQQLEQVHAVVLGEAEDGRRDRREDREAGRAQVAEAEAPQVEFDGSAQGDDRWEESRGGKEGVSTGRARRAMSPYKTK